MFNNTNVCLNQINVESVPSSLVYFRPKTQRMKVDAPFQLSEFKLLQEDDAYVCHGHTNHGLRQRMDDDYDQ